MAITKELLYGSKFFIVSEQGRAWLESKLVPKYADSVTYDSATSTLSVIRDDKTLFKYQKTSSSVLKAYICYANSVTNESTENTSAAMNQWGFTTSNGVVIVQEKGGDFTGKVLFTLDHVGNTVVVMSKDFTSETSDSFYCARAGIRVPSAPSALTYTSPSWSMTTMVPMPVYVPSGEVAYTPNVFFCPTNEWKDFGKKILIDEKPYLMLGTWLLKDDEEEPQTGDDCGDAHGRHEHPHSHHR